jgi:hypothetical protein
MCASIFNWMQEDKMKSRVPMDWSTCRKRSVEWKMSKKNGGEKMLKWNAKQECIYLEIPLPPGGEYLLMSFGGKIWKEVREKRGKCEGKKGKMTKDKGNVKLKGEHKCKRGKITPIRVRGVNFGVWRGDIMCRGGGIWFFDRYRPLMQSKKG